MDEPSLLEPGMGLDGRNRRLIMALTYCWERGGSGRPCKHWLREYINSHDFSSFYWLVVLLMCLLCRIEDCLYFCFMSTTLTALCCAADLQNPNQHEFLPSFMLQLVLAHSIFDRRSTGRTPKNRSYLVGR